MQDLNRLGLARSAKLSGWYPSQRRSRAHPRTCPVQQQVGPRHRGSSTRPHRIAAQVSASHTRADAIAARVEWDDGDPHGPSEHIVIPLGDAENGRATPLVTPATSDNWAWALITLQMHEFGDVGTVGVARTARKRSQPSAQARDVAAWQTTQLARWASPSAA